MARAASGARPLGRSQPSSTDSCASPLPLTEPRAAASRAQRRHAGAPGAAADAQPKQPRDLVLSAFPCAPSGPTGEAVTGAAICGAARCSAAAAAKRGGGAAAFAGRRCAACGDCGLACDHPATDAAGAACQAGWTLAATAPGSRGRELCQQPVLHLELSTPGPACCSTVYGGRGWQHGGNGSGRGCRRNSRYARHASTSTAGPASKAGTLRGLPSGAAKPAASTTTAAAGTGRERSSAPRLLL